MRNKWVSSKKRNINSKIVFGIILLLIICLFGLILPKNIKTYSHGIYQNYFYFKAINNTLSVIESSNIKEKYTVNNDIPRIILLSFLGIDMANPIAIITKESAYLRSSQIIPSLNTDSMEDIKTFILNPFKLEDKQINKVPEKPEGTNQVATLDNPTLKKTLNKAIPEVLIYHSHTSEAYSDDNMKQSMDGTKTVCTVGDVIAEELEQKYGIAVIHDKTVHDRGDYDGAYKKSGVTLDKYLKEYGDFKMIIDLHRDSVQKSAVTTKINGKNVARFMFVVTQKNPRYVEQKKLIDSMIKKSNRIFPDLLRSNEIFAYQWGMNYYNQNRSDNAVLLEVGSDSNTIDEVKNTGKYLARIIAEQINGKSE